MRDAPQSARVPAIRDAVQRAVDRTTLRAVAAQVGMSHPGLLAFLEGGEPRPATLKKLAGWYVKHAAESGEVDTDAVAAALTLLVDGLPKEEASATRARLVEELRDGYKRSGTPPPPWLDG